MIHIKGRHTDVPHGYVNKSRKLRTRFLLGKNHIKGRPQDDPPNYLNEI